MRFKLALGTEKKRKEEDNSANDSALRSEHNDGLLHESRGSCKVQKSRGKGRKGQQRQDKEVICPILGGLKAGCGDRVQAQGWILIRAWSCRVGWETWRCSGNTGEIEEDKISQGAPGGLLEQGERGCPEGLFQSKLFLVLRFCVPSTHSFSPGCLGKW